MTIRRPRRTVKLRAKVRKVKKKPSPDTTPHPDTSQGASTVPRMDFNSRNLGTGRPSIQCTACGEYTHWRRECPYDNYCTTCNNNDDATHMCRAPRQATRNQQSQQSPSICIYCGSTDHSSVNCLKRPWGNREQLCGTPDALRNQQNQPSNTKISRNSPGNAAVTGANTCEHFTVPTALTQY